MSEKKYYIQRHASGYLGNAPIWWVKGGCGYSAYIEKAETFTREEAEKICGVPIGEKGEKYKAWDVGFIQSGVRTVFDAQDFGCIEQWELSNKSEKYFLGDVRDKLAVHILLDALFSASGNKTIDPEICDSVEDIANAYCYNDMNDDDIQSLYNSGY